MLFFDFWRAEKIELHSQREEKVKEVAQIGFFFISYNHYAPPPYLETETLIMLRLLYKRDPSTLF